MNQFKVFAGVCAAILVSLCLGAPGATVVEGSDTWFCCPDEWQGGNVCPPGQRLASYCADSSCSGCGTFFCYTQPSGLGKFCYQ